MGEGSLLRGIVRNGEGVIVEGALCVMGERGSLLRGVVRNG